MTRPPRLFQPMAFRLGLLACIAFALLAAADAAARTITLDDTQVFHIAHIGPQVPQASWLGRHSSPGIYVNNYMDMTPGRRFLIRYPIESIPPGQRIVSATWTIPVDQDPRVPIRLFVWRLLTPWGLGVNHQYRTQLPKPVPWAEPGAGAPGIDRAITPTATINIEGVGEQVIDVTQDVEMWYTGMAPNHGWVMAIDEANTVLRLYTPLYNGRGKYRLRITYEPE